MKWHGPTVVVATGPSLTPEDCGLVEMSWLRTVGVNSAWKFAPWVDCIYAGDYRYWKEYRQELEASGFTGKRYSRSSRAEKVFGAKYIKSRLGNDYNSGQMAVEMAIRYGSDPVVMLGFDCSVTHGFHCHGPHDKTPNPNEERCRRWLEQFERINKYYPDANIVNCSRETALTCFPRDTLENVLARLSEPSSRRRGAA